LNAGWRHATEGHEHPEIQLVLSLDAPEQSRFSDPIVSAGSDGWCCIRCRDNGCGIASDKLEHIFEPFYTTRDVGEGSGLGLAMVYGAVQNHHGLIDVESIASTDAAGGGTTFSIYLPLNKACTPLPKEESNLFAGGVGRGVLVIDDDEFLREVLVEVLLESGFRVWQAEDGEAGVSLYQQHMQAIDLVLTDVVMPKMGGVEAAEAIRLLDGEVPIVFQTGYGEERQLLAATSFPGCRSLRKPVSIPELLATIEEILP